MDKGRSNNFLMITINKMKKILLVSFLALICLAALPVLAQTKPAKIDTVCLQKAVDKRETAIIAANDVVSAGVKSALEQRKTALNQAWGLADQKERMKARNTAWTNFRKARQTARKTYNTAVKTAWQAFHTDGKACKVTTQGVEPQASDLSTEQL